MRKNLFYTVMMMAVMAVVTISFTACGGSDSDDPLDNTGPDYSVVGTWQITELPEGKSDMKVGDQIVITADGKIYDKTDQLGTWAKGGQCYLTDSEEYPVPFTAKVLSLTENFMSIDITIFNMTFNMKFMRLADIPVVPDNNQGEQDSGDISAYIWPCLQWGCSLSDIKTYMASSSMVVSEEREDILMYTTTDNKYKIYYAVGSNNQYHAFQSIYMGYSQKKMNDIAEKVTKDYGITFNYDGGSTWRAEGTINGKNCQITIYGMEGRNGIALDIAVLK